MFCYLLSFPADEQINCSEENYSSVFTREQSSLSVMSPQQLLHMRKKSKLKNKKFNQVSFHVKNMGTLLPKKKIWVFIEGLMMQREAGWKVTKVHSYYSYLQDYIMKDYIEQNQKRRMESTEPVVIKLMKDANNKAYGANTQKIKDRKNVILLIDRIQEIQKAESYSQGFTESIASKEELEKLTGMLQERLSDVNSNDPNFKLIEESLLEQYQNAELLASLSTFANDPKQQWAAKKADAVYKSWTNNNDLEHTIYQAIRQKKANSFNSCTEINSIKYMITTKKKKLEVKSTRYIGSDILTKAKISIKSFSDRIVQCFDPTINKDIVQDMQDMEIARVIPSLIFTDTDSVYFNFLAVFKVHDTNVTEEQFQQWVRHSIVIYCKDRLDTSNMLNSPFSDMSLRKKLNRFQFVTNEPCIKQIVAVNPKEYCITS